MLNLILLWVGINMGLLWLIKRATHVQYDSMFCRDVRAQMNMFAYRTRVEAAREQLNRTDSKF